jgi:formate hydrogenlyase subunit 6/NADH:ubiquinone oxidoreductase subunit I
MPLDVLDRILRPLRRGTATSRYPDVPPELSPAARGLPELDRTRCDGTAACVAACPTSAIRVTGPAWSLDAGACVFCGACERACPSGAIRLGHRIELAAERREDLVIERTWRVER